MRPQSRIPRGMFPGVPVNEETLAPVAQRDLIQFAAQPLRMDKNGRPIWRGMAVSDDDDAAPPGGRVIFDDDDDDLSGSSAPSATSAQRSAHLPPAGGRAERKLRIKLAEESFPPTREPAAPEPAVPAEPVERSTLAPIEEDAAMITPATTASVIDDAVDIV